MFVNASARGSSRRDGTWGSRSLSTPFGLLDNASMTAVPGPSTYAAVAGGLRVWVGVARRRMTQ